MNVLFLTIGRMESIEEPLPKDSPFWKMNNVIITPHNSFVGEHNAERLWEVIKTNLENKLL